jgi:hypothetical protein
MAMASIPNKVGKAVVGAAKQVGKVVTAPVKGGKIAAIQADARGKTGVDKAKKVIQGVGAGIAHPNKITQASRLGNGPAAKAPGGAPLQVIKQKPGATAKPVPTLKIKPQAAAAPAPAARRAPAPPNVLGAHRSPGGPAPKPGAPAAPKSAAAPKAMGGHRRPNSP